MINILVVIVVFSSDLLFGCETSQTQPTTTNTRCTKLEVVQNAWLHCAFPAIPPNERCWRH